MNVAAGGATRSVFGVFMTSDERRVVSSVRELLPRLFVNLTKPSEKLRKTPSPPEQLVARFPERFGNERRTATLVFARHGVIISPRLVTATGEGLERASPPARGILRGARVRRATSRGGVFDRRGGRIGEVGRRTRGWGCGAPVRGRPRESARARVSRSRRRSGLGARGDGRDVAFGETRGRGGRALGRSRVRGERIARERAGSARVRDRARRA